MENGETTVVGKRPREEGKEDDEFSPESKRLQAELFLDILEDVDDRDSVDDAGDVCHLADVMRSLEEEIGLPSPQCVFANYDGSGDDVFSTELNNGGDSVDGSRQPDVELGYLFEASDDELGLPPTTASALVSPSEEGDFSGQDVVVVRNQNWEFVDDMASSYDAFDLGFDVDVVKTVSSQENVVDDGYSDLLLSSSANHSDLSPEISWFPEYLPAV